jgi:hypothetical protein
MTEQGDAIIRLSRGGQDDGLRVYRILLDGADVGPSRSVGCWTATCRPGGTPSRPGSTGQAARQSRSTSRLGSCGRSS